MLSEFSGDTFRTTELPASRAGMIFAVAGESGEFHGITAATTPAASRRTTLRTGDAGPEGTRVSSQRNSSATFRQALACRVRPGCPARVNQRAEPFSSEIRCAAFSAFSSRSALNRRRTAIRSAGGVRRHSPASNEARAAVTARSMSVGCVCATRAGQQPGATHHGRSRGSLVS